MKISERKRKQTVKLLLEAARELSEIRIMIAKLKGEWNEIRHQEGF